MKTILSIVVVLAGIGLIYYLSKNSKLLSLFSLQTDNSTTNPEKKASETAQKDVMVSEKEKKQFAGSVEKKETKPDYTQPVEPVGTTVIPEPLTPKQNVIVKLFNNRRKAILPPQELPYVYDEEGVLVPNGQYRA